jgi:hypothetical protein
MIVFLYLTVKYHITMKLNILFLLCFSATISTAQISVPAPSPLGKTTQKVGLTDVSIEYSRPSVKGRAIFGGLVEYDQMWRWGANASTKFTVSDDVTLNGHDIPAGTYALYAIPTADEWTIVVHTNLKHWGTGDDKYDSTEDLVRFTVAVDNAYPVLTETMTFQFSDLTTGGCNLEFMWENVHLTLAINTNVDEQVMKEIDVQMQGVSAATYYQAARYYYDNDKDMTKAYEWINLALVNNEKFWIVRQKALIEAKLGQYKNAIATAEKSKELALQAKNDHYVKLNEKSIEEWSKIKK